MEQHNLINPRKDVDGYTLYDLVDVGWTREAIGAALFLIWQGDDHGVKFEADGVLIKVLNGSNAERLHKAWVLARKCSHPRTVGPYPTMLWVKHLYYVWWAVDLFGKPFERVPYE